MRLLYSIDVNQPTWTGATRTYDVVNAGSDHVHGHGAVYPSAATAGLTKPSPNDGNFQVSYSGLNTWYNAMAVTVKHQMSYGFEALLNYTWAHTHDAGQTGNGGGAVNTGGGSFLWDRRYPRSLQYQRTIPTRPSI